jgi:hypothetical protein
MQHHRTHDYSSYRRRRYYWSTKSPANFSY